MLPACVVMASWTVLLGMALVTWRVATLLTDILVIVDLMMERVLGLVVLVLLCSSLATSHPGLDGMNVFLSMWFNPRTHWIAVLGVYFPLVHGGLSLPLLSVIQASVVARAAETAETTVQEFCSCSRELRGTYLCFLCVFGGDCLGAFCSFAWVPMTK